MASNKIKGLTIAINGETTGLDKALAGVNSKSKDLQSELKEIEKLLKLDPSNTELLAQKQKLLGDSVQSAKEKLDTLKTATEQAQEKLANGDIGEDQFRALQREVVKAEENLKGLEDKAKNFGDVFSQKMKNAGKDVEEFGGKVKKAGEAFAPISKGAAAVAGGLVALSESTRDYREDMGKLETAFTTAGFSAEDAKQVYSDFYAVLGESDRSVEAANHLAKLTNSQQGLSEWTTIATGVFATFGDSLPIEGLTEAANETAKVGKVTGPLADALNWAGVSEDAFNKKLASTASEQERASMITNTLNGLYSDAADKYREVSGAVMEANEAHSELTDNLSELGAAVEPIVTDLIKKLTDALSVVVGWVKGLSESQKEFAFTALLVVAAISPIIVVVGTVIEKAGVILALLPKIKGAIVAVNAAMAANPILAVVAVIAALVAALIVLWNTNEDFRNAIINIWEAIKDGVGKSIDGIVGFFTETIPNALGALKDFFTDNWKDILLLIVNPIAGILTLLYNTNPEFKKWADNLLEGIVGWFKGIGDALSKWASELRDWITTEFPAIVSQIVDFFVGVPGKIWDAIVDAVYAIGDWATDMIAKAKEVVPEVVEKIVTFFKELPGKMVDIGKNIVEGLWEGIKSMGSWIKEKVGGLVDGLVGGVKNVLGIHSPSKVFAGIGEYMAEGLGNGFADQMRAVSKQISSSIPTDFEDTLSYATTPIVTPARAAQTTAQTDSVGATSNASNASRTATVQPAQKIEIIFSGSYAQLARALNPIVKMGNNLAGPSLVEGIV